MDSKVIYKALRNKYQDQKYILQNSYVFDWESDFFFMTLSKLFVEVEIKVSRSDFMADFKKFKKHETIKRTVEGKKRILTKGYKVYSYEYDEEEYIRPRVYDEITKQPLKRLTGRRLKSTIETGEQYFKEVFLPKLKNPIFEESSCVIFIKKLPLCPNKFYYACPENLIQPNEVPKYSGLIWVDEKGVCKIVKKAPQIHKEKLNLDKVLLDKFYYKCLRLENKI